VSGLNVEKGVAKWLKVAREVASLTLSPPKRRYHHHLAAMRYSWVRRV